jgi:protoporphyrinogen oxidase
MKVAIIGAGYVGLTAAIKLLEEGQEVTIFEKDNVPGGLASGFSEKGWKWNLEKHYHHVFTSDNIILDLAKKVGQEMIFVSPETLTYYEGEMLRLDSPVSLLKFNKIGIFDRLRTGAILAYLKITSDWETLEKKSAKEFLTKWMGEKSWKVLWKPLFVKKFGKEYEKIPASWFWARIKKRSSSLGYPVGGFDSFTQKLVTEVIKSGGIIKYKESVSEVKKNKEDFVIITDKGQYEFDKVICTQPSSIFARIVKGLPQKYSDRLLSLKGIGAINLVLELNKSLLGKGKYWLSVNEEKLPFLCIVEHTNFMEKKHYGGKHIIYIGKYLNPDHEYFDLTANELLKKYIPGIKEINSKFVRSWITGMKIFKAPFAQPLVEKNYSKRVPEMESPIKGLYLANIEQVYPWDRGVNYSVELGYKVAELTLQ